MKRYNLYTLSNLDQEKLPRKRRFKEEIEEERNPAKVYVMERGVINRINKYVDEHYKDDSFKYLSKDELKRALRNRVMDYNKDKLERCHDLPDSDLYKEVMNKLPKDYYTY